MAETQHSMSSNDAGNATDSSSKAQRARGASDVPVANLKINQDEFLKRFRFFSWRRVAS
jgi:hypothetical protein